MAGGRLGLTMAAKQGFTAYVMLAPWIIGILGFTLYPFINAMILSFGKSDVFSYKFIGITNFIELMGDKRFLKSLEVTVKYTFLSVPLKLVVALIIATILSKSTKIMHLLRTVFYIPSLIGGSVAVAVMWRMLFGYEGLWNSFLALFGIRGREWLGTPEYALALLILLVAWQFGSSMIIFLAGLKNVPRELLEAAQIDGANSFQTYFSVTLPMLTPIIQFNLILQLIGSFQTFTQGYLITKGGPMDETLFTVLYIYQQGFGAYRMGYAAAMSWVLFMIILLVTRLVFISSKFWVYYND
ncbi:MAG: sugar ABC transporter permease [Treponema sp.]|jgi:multiple sugar transport system permease protein|nr:sugar ABC transporter permease [Treponema sp.]